MPTILLDENVDGYADYLSRFLFAPERGDVCSLLDIRVATFDQVGLAKGTADGQVWALVADGTGYNDGARSTARKDIMDAETPAPIPPEIMTELRAAAEYAAKGVRDPEVMRKACERMDAMREKNRRLFGVQDVGVQIIREMRDRRDFQRDE